MDETLARVASNVTRARRAKVIETRASTAPRCIVIFAVGTVTRGLRHSAGDSRMHLRVIRACLMATRIARMRHRRGNQIPRADRTARDDTIKYDNMNGHISHAMTHLIDVMPPQVKQFLAGIFVRIDVFVGWFFTSSLQFSAESARARGAEFVEQIMLSVSDIL